MSEEKKENKEKETKPVVNIGTLVGKKVGMTQLFDDAGNVVPVTVVEAGPCVVVQVKTKDNDGYSAIQVGFGKKKANKISKPLKGHLKELNASVLKEIKVEKPEDFKVGQEIKVDIFKSGDFVSISGNGIGKGFAGNIKRHHHHRGLMTHGSKSHRITGSIGAGTSPGKVYKGKSMPGRMGGKKVTVQGLKVFKIDSEKNLILVQGSVPGKSGNLVMIEKEG